MCWYPSSWDFIVFPFVNAPTIFSESFEWPAVATLVRERMRDKNSEKAIVIAKEEIKALEEATSAKEYLLPVAKKLKETLEAERKLLLYDVGGDYRNVETLDAKDKSRDDFQYGGVIFENGGFTYDANGARARQVG